MDRARQDEIALVLFKRRARSILAPSFEKLRETGRRLRWSCDELKAQFMTIRWKVYGDAGLEIFEEVSEIYGIPLAELEEFDRLLVEEFLEEYFPSEEMV